MAPTPKLKEDPQEWRNFTLSSCAAAGLAAFLIHRKGRLPLPPAILFSSLILVAVLAVLRPGWFRPFYRIFMTIGFHIGQVVGRILLGVIFLIAIVPIGLALRLTGRDLLGRQPRAGSYWILARPPGRLDQMF